MDNLLDSVSTFITTNSVSQGAWPSTPKGLQWTLYGTGYSLLTKYYLGLLDDSVAHSRDIISSCQEPDTGLLVGPELRGFLPKHDSIHDLEHLRWHSTITALPVCQEFGIELQPILAAHKFCDEAYLEAWLSQRDWTNAWLEGNNLLFVGQLLVYLRDIEKHPAAENALTYWFEWLDREADPMTSLWGTQGYCSVAAAVYGGYHQLLVYWHEGRPIVNPEGLVDTVLSLRHPDGGFNPGGNGGACEDVDSVDILVNCYKRWDYRRAEIRQALWRCVDHILSTRNPDGGFPYNRNQFQSHMGIPGTQAEPNVSGMFPTWFRVHTLALCAEIVPEHPEFAGRAFRFNSFLSMGWHQSPVDWDLNISNEQLREERLVRRRYAADWLMYRLVDGLGPVRPVMRKIRRRMRKLSGQ